MKKRASSGLFCVVDKWVALLCCVILILAVAAVAGGGAKVIAVTASPQKHPIYSVETEEMKVSLGINCAWDNTDIEQILQILDHYNLKASFFVVGDWCDQYPESVRQIAAAGHEVGSHSDSHADMTLLDEEGILKEIRESCRKIEELTGTAPTLFRPPSGAYDNQAIELIEREGLYPIQWDCDSLDYRNPTADQMQVRIFKKLRRGSILLFHSGAKNTPGALPQIIEAILAEGYEFVPVSELIHPPPYRVDFEGRQHPAGPDAASRHESSP